MILVHFSLHKMQKLTKNQNTEPLNVLEMTVFGPPKSQKLISRKI